MAMEPCAACGQTIAFGAKDVSGHKVCSDKCVEAVVGALTAQKVPESAALERAQQIHSGACPKCGGVGQPVDLQAAHRCISLVFMTRRSSKMELSCHACGNKMRLRESLLTLVLGWWGFPWGLIYTPVQIGKNISAMSAAPSTGPSADLVYSARKMLAKEQGLLS